VQIICPECGQPFDDSDQCWACVARRADIEETFFLSSTVAFAGILGIITATYIYPPLESNSLVEYSIPGLIIIPGVIVLVLQLCWRLTRYAPLVRSMLVFVAATFVIMAAYYFLNGALDGNPTVEGQALVSGKYYNSGRGSTYNLDWTLSLKGQTIEDSLGVSRETFSSAQPGDAVRIVIHPGAFSTPWRSDVHLLGSRTGDSR